MPRVAVTIHHRETGPAYNTRKPVLAGGRDMTLQTLRTLRNLEGHHVQVRLGDGSRLDCELVSTARRGAGTVWLHDDAGDHFVHVDEIVELLEIA
jgi:hypothetical protein